MSTLAKLRKDKRIKHVDDERESGNGIIITLNKYTNDRLGECHTFGSDSVKEAIYNLNKCVACDCNYCK